MLTPYMLHWGYAQGAFPMGDDDGSVDWYSVDQRALFPISGMHVSQSLKKVIRSSRFRITFDVCFEDVMRACRRPKDNWINEPIIRCFTLAHEQGWAHSGEVWEGDDLVGGIYGVAFGSCFCAESMFHREDNASKVALWAMIEHCRELGFTIFDAEVMNPHLRSLGAYEIPLAEYLEMFREASTHRTQWSPKGRLPG